MSIISPRNVGGRGAMAVCSRPTIWRWRASFSFYFLRLSSLRFFGSPLSESPWLEVSTRRKKKTGIARGVDLSLSTRKRSGGARDQEEHEGRLVQFVLLFDLIPPPLFPSADATTFRVGEKMLTAFLHCPPGRREESSGGHPEIFITSSLVALRSTDSTVDESWQIKEIDAGFRSVAAMMEAWLCYFKIWQRPNDEIWAK